MNLKSQGSSASVVVSLVAAVAVNSAVALWFHQKQMQRLTNGDSSQGKEEDDFLSAFTSRCNQNIKELLTYYNSPKGRDVDDEKSDARSFKSDARSDTSRKHRRQPKMKQTRSEDVSVTLATSSKKVVGKPVSKDCISRPRVLVASSKKGRPPKSTPKSTPRVRESLLPWNNNINASSKKSKQRSTRKITTATKQSICYDDGMTSPSVPRVRESLLPWSNKKNQNNTFHLKSSSKRQTDAKIQTPVVKQPIVFEDNNEITKSAPRVRESLLPWSQKKKLNDTFSRAKNHEEDITSAPKSSIEYDDGLDCPSVPRVRESLLPWSHKKKQNETLDLPVSSEITIEEESSVLEHPVSGELQIEEKSPILEDSPDSPSSTHVLESQSPWRDEFLERSESEIIDLTLNDDENFAPASKPTICHEDSLDSAPIDPVKRNTNGNRRTRSVRDRWQNPNVALAQNSGSENKRSPLMDSTNNRKKGRSRSKWENREKIEKVWKNSASQLSPKALASPTLTQLSTGDNNSCVRSLQKVFER